MKNELPFLQDLMLLSRAVQLVLQDGVLEGLGEPVITSPRANILRFTNRRGRQSVNEIALFLGQTKAAASQNVDTLVKAGLVSRETDPDDRRCVWVSITARGKGFLRKAEARQMELIKRALSQLPEAARAQFALTMRQVAFTLLENVKMDSAGCLQCCAYESAGCLRRSAEWSCRYLCHHLESRDPGTDSPAEAVAAGKPAPRS